MLSPSFGITAIPPFPRLADPRRRPTLLGPDAPQSASWLLERLRRGPESPATSNQVVR